MRIFSAIFTVDVAMDVQAHDFQDVIANAGSFLPHLLTHGHPYAIKLVRQAPTMIDGDCVRLD